METQSIICITGATGLLGSAMTSLLAKQGYSRLLTPDRKALNLLEAATVREYMLRHRPEYIIHLAARVGGIAANQRYPAEFIYENSCMHLHVLEAARLCGARLVVIPGSACAYPADASQPLQEASMFSGPPEPSNHAYAMAKLHGLVMAQSYAQQYGIEVRLPIFTNLYGEADRHRGEDAHVITALMEKMLRAVQQRLPQVEVWGSGAPTRDFLHAEDAAQAIIHLMQIPFMQGMVNVGSGEEISIDELAEMIKQVTGYTGALVFDPSRPDGAPRKLLCSNKMRSLGWQPRIALREGLVRIAEAWSAGRWSAQA